MAQEINAEQFEELVLKATKPVIIDFYSTECPPCEALAPKFEFFADLYKNEIKFYKIFRQGNRELSSDLGVKGSPTLLFYLNGKEVAPRLKGAIKKSEIKKNIIEGFGIEDKTREIERKELNYDLAIIGAGPAGLTSAIYAGRAKINTVVIDKGNPGGQVNVTHIVANYPGTESEIQGFMLMHKMFMQAKNNNVDFLSSSEIEDLDLSNKTIKVDDDKLIKAKTIILSTGAKPRSLGLPGEDELFGNGISYCATCDGAFYEGKDIFVIGGGNTAVEEALFLTNFVNKLTIIHQFDEFQANKMASDEALNHPKIDVMWSCEPRAFIGDKSFEKLEVENLKTKERMVLDGRDGVFIFVGYVPQTELFEKQVDLDEWGYVQADELMKTSKDGVFVAGDVRNKTYRQITTAVSDGTIAALEVQKYLKNNK